MQSFSFEGPRRARIVVGEDFSGAIPQPFSNRRSTTAGCDNARATGSVLWQPRWVSRTGVSAEG
jgi:hypothetical protein